MIDKIYDGLHMDERPYEQSDNRIEDLVRYFQKTLPEKEYLLLDELMSRQSAAIAHLFPQYFKTGVKAGFQLSKELSEEIDDIENL